jgi:putative ABC transport system permease protein
MLKNYLITTWRSLVQNKLYSILNIAGLTFGISCFLLVGLYLFEELSFDRYHSKSDRIYRIIERRDTRGKETTVAGVGYQVAEESPKKIAEIEATARISRFGRDNIRNPENRKNMLQENITTSDNNVFTIFDFTFIDGDRNTPLTQPNSIVLTETMARKLFNSTQVTGKTVTIDFIESTPLKITGVIKDHPSNSSFDFTYMISLNTFMADSSFRQNVNADWSSNGYLTYVLLKENVNAQAVAPKLDKLLTDNFKPDANVKMNFRLQPFTDMRLYSEGILDGARNSNVAAIGQGSLLYVKIFAIVALFVLLIACINYMNLTTARFSNRSKEIGIRKTVGAERKQLVTQFLTESLGVTFISFLFSIAVVNLLLPAFNQFTGKQLSFGIHTDYKIWLYALLVTIGVGLLSGIYPSLMLSKYNPVSLLKGAKISNKSGLGLRRALVVLQFTISVVMIVATIVLIMQVKYVSSKNLGFNQGQLLVVDINSGGVRRGAQTIRTEFAKIPGVKDVSVTTRVPGEWKNIPTVKIRTEEDTREHSIAYLIGADEYFAKTFEVQVLKGRNFINNNDSASIILNESAAKMLNVQEAGGQMVEIPERAALGIYSPLPGNAVFKAKVIGIVKDFHFQSLREKIAPMVLVYRNNPVQSIDYFTARIEGRQQAAIMKQMQEVMAQIDINHFFEFHFLDEQLARFYREDRKRETLLIGIAFATIFIACLGLFGLATYAAAQRIKEIGVRKVLGATVTQLASLLAKDFLKLVLISNCIAFPLAWWATNTWLQEFAYHIELQWWIFAIAGIAAIIVALITVSFQAIRVATANPVKSLRTE